jgi:hypothetical protein
MKNHLVSVTSVLLLVCLIAAIASLLQLRSEPRNLSSQEVEEENESSSITRDRNLQVANVVGNNGGGGVFPLGLCQGDCDNDDECLGDLICFQRNGETIPGCADGDQVNGRADFCIENPSDGDGGDDNGGDNGDDNGGDNGGNNGGDNGGDNGGGNLQVANIVGNNGGGGVFPLGLCQGDCDNDDECQDDLICFQRNGGTIPGCGDNVNQQADFCIQKNPSDGDDGNNGGGNDGGNDGNDDVTTFSLKLFWEPGKSIVNLGIAS